MHATPVRETPEPRWVRALHRLGAMGPHSRAGSVPVNEILLTHWYSTGTIRSRAIDSAIGSRVWIWIGFRLSNSAYVRKITRIAGWDFKKTCLSMWTSRYSTSGTSRLSTYEPPRQNRSLRPLLR